MRAIRSTNRQSGMVLLICMIFLTAMMLLGLTASADTLLQTRLTANLHESERVKQMAQTTLEFAEKQLQSHANSVDGDCRPSCEHATLLFAGSVPDNVQNRALTWWRARGHLVNQDKDHQKIHATAKPSGFYTASWLISMVHEETVNESTGQQQRWFRVLARSGNATDTVVSVLESIVLLNSSTGEKDKNASGPEQPQSSGDYQRVAWRRLR